jgi:YfiH family protein
MNFRTTTRDMGSFAIDAEPVALAERRRAAVDRPWVWLRQVHGAEVVVVTRDNAEEVCGTEADALVTAEPGIALAIQTADCAPVMFHGEHGVLGIAHAGWRGLEGGVIERTAEAMATLGAGRIRLTVGPHIVGSCYEFGEVDLQRLEGRFGPSIRTQTAQGTPALDLATLIQSAWRGPVLPNRRRPHDECTACHPERWFSHRARRETERMATVVWREP